MSKSGNRVVVKDNKTQEVKRLRTDKEIVDENEPKNKKDEKSNKQKEQKMGTVMMVDNEEQDKAVEIGVVGVGQCGGRLAETFDAKGYDTFVINSAEQDLRHIKVKEHQKMFLEASLGGAGKDLAMGDEIVRTHSKKILQELEKRFEDNEVLLLAISGGGGTGSGGAEAMVNIMSELGKPLIVLFAMPLASEDTLAKHNTIQTLSKLAKMAREDIINSLMVVDNEKINMLYPGLSMAKFWSVANNAIVEPLHLFNSLSAKSSEHHSLDPMDFSTILIGTGDCALYGKLELEDYMEEDAIAEAILTNMKNGLLASEFNLEDTRSAGVIITGSKEVLDNLPSINVDYGISMLQKECGESARVFKGVYEVEEHDSLHIYCLLGGLGLPKERVQELKLEAERHMEKLEGKEDMRATNMNVDLGKTQAVSQTDLLHKRIKQKKSGLGKLKKNTRKDRRRR